MAFSRARNQISIRRTAKSSTTWSLCWSLTGVQTVGAGNKLLSVLFASSVLAELVPFTIVRTRALVSVVSDQLAASELQIGAFGIGIVNDVAGALGITGIPGPDTDCGWPGWFVFQWLQGDFQFGDATGFNPQGFTQYVIDSKAMRKVSAEQDIAVVFENSSGTQGFQAINAGRMLIKAG